jgi:NTE family protein
MRVGLALGAGGLVGASWLIGALEALQAETGWEPSEADAIVGTSAGSVVGALAAAGMPAGYMADYVAGCEVDAIAEAAQRAGQQPTSMQDAVALAQALEQDGARPDGTGYRLARALPPIGPGSWRLALATLRRPLSYSPAAVLTGWLPRGFVRTDPISELVETFVPGDWPDHPAFAAVAADYSTGRRVAFGLDDAPPARVSEAVAASCAIPACYHPGTIGGRRYVDGGICSPSNLDLLCGRGLDLAICLSPMSSLAQVSGGSPGDRIGAFMRGLAGRRLGHEARKLREEGTEVLILQPTAEDLKVMGLNMMSGRRRVAVTETAAKTTALSVRALRDSNAMLPGRTWHRRAARRGAAAQARKRRAA